jgi:hypothetical protein
MASALREYYTNPVHLEPRDQIAFHSGDLGLRKNNPGELEMLPNIVDRQLPGAMRSRRPMLRRNTLLSMQGRPRTTTAQPS